jgi:non-ribosomal peptide synthetase component F
VLFTSGSTGVPKGVDVRASSVQSYLDNLQGLYQITQDDRLSQIFDLTFDPSVHDLFVCWSVGATLVPFSAADLASPVEHARARDVTVWFSVPSVIALLEQSRRAVVDALPALRLSFFCGEKLSLATVQAWRRIAPNTRIVNLYGPTEATIAITHFEVEGTFAEDRALYGFIPIGTAFAGQHAECRQADGVACVPGQVGSLWLGGDQVAVGYHAEPELTQTRFVENYGVRWYDSGDLALCDSHGSLQFVGRNDEQVKVMGHRIELGEIEHALSGVAGAAYVIAGVAALHDGLEELYAVLPASLASEKKRIRAALRKLLPAYMVPRYYFFETDVPRNFSGKIDRQALRERLLAKVAARQSGAAREEGGHTPDS